MSAPQNGRMPNLSPNDMLRAELVQLRRALAAAHQAAQHERIEAATREGRLASCVKVLVGIGCSRSIPVADWEATFTHNLRLSIVGGMLEMEVVRVETPPVPKPPEDDAPPPMRIVEP